MWCPGDAQEINGRKSVVHRHIKYSCAVFMKCIDSANSPSVSNTYNCNDNIQSQSDISKRVDSGYWSAMPSIQKHIAFLVSAFFFSGY